MKYVVLISLAYNFSCLSLQEYRRATIAETASHVAKLTVDLGADGEDDGHCTAWHLGHDVWVSARHCTFDGAAYTLRGRPVTVTAKSATEDCALFRGPWARGGMLLDTTPLVLGDRLHYIGYPSFDWVHFGVFEGLYGGLEGGEGTTGIDGERDIMFSSQTDGGASGSPLMNGEGKVVGIVVSSFRFTQYSYAEPIKCVVDLLND